MGVPVLTNCCFCLSLRRGLLTYIYIKLVLLLIAIIIIFVGKQEIDAIAQKYHDKDIEMVAKITDVIAYLTLTLVLLELPFAICGLVGAHKENVKLIKVFYYYLFAGVILYAIWFALQIFSGSFKQVAQTAIAVAFTVYILLVARSEIKRLQGETMPTQSGQPMGEKSTAYPGA